ncbi:sphingosine-1-phosphate phosphatase 1 [Anguilla rostrata]|uniref:sphingosine-1-phosphate phosphatase 1 n=1 Tax=Anguilla rostrata TaxID=7938 RepID=UPI0030D0BBF9
MGLIDMASNAKTRFTQLCKNLEDPHHVARFQKICGVIGTFSGISTEKTHEQEQLYNGTCIKHCEGESDNYDIYAGSEKVTDGHRQRKNTATGTRTEQDGCKNGLLNGTGLNVGAGETGGYTFCSGVTSASASENPTNDCGVDRISTKDADSQNESSKNRSAVKPMRKNSLTGDTGQEFLIENKFLYYLFTVGTELGNELFYITFFPFFAWNVDAYVCRRLMIVWVWVMYLGQCTKDIIRWSRPASPPVVKVEVFYNSEYSMPSTHAMAGTAIPFELFLLTYSRWEYPFTLGLVLSFSWCILVCLSRIYMGMHSILDVIAGFLYSMLILVVFQPALDVIDNFNLTCQYAPLIIVSLHLGMGFFSFTLDTWSTSRGDTAQILGSGAGFALASHLNRRLGVMLDPPPSQLPLTPPPLGPGLVGLCLLRLVLGMALLLLIRAVMKALTIPLVCRLAGVPGDDVRKARRHMEVELPYRYIVYGTVGFSVLYLVPEAFRWIGLL